MKTELKFIPIHNSDKCLLVDENENEIIYAGSSREKAQYIVTAVNNHEAMKEALGDFVVNVDQAEYKSLVNRAKEILSKLSPQ